MPWATAVAEDGRFEAADLLGHEKVRNYDGSWTEWGSLIGVPIEKG